MDMSKRGKAHTCELGSKAFQLAENSDKPRVQARQDLGQLLVVATERMQR